MGITSWFRTLTSKAYKRWSEIGKYNATFTKFGDDIYKSDIVRSCIRPLAEQTSKANATCTNKAIEQILNNRPNLYMNGKDFLAKVRTLLELQNTVFIYIIRDDKNHVTGFYPVPFMTYEAVEYQNGLYIKFRFASREIKELIVPWEDLAVLRKDYHESDIGGDDNYAILPGLELINTTNQGIANAVKSTANLRGILKSKIAMLAPEDVKKQRDAFVKDYMNLENEGGIASIDNSQEFTPIKMEPVIVNYTQMREFRENVYRYFGVNDDIVMSNYTEQQMESFYNARIEPFLVALSVEFTSKVFTERERGFKNQIVYEANRLQFASMATKISVFKEIVLYGGMTINEWRTGCNMAPIEGGDTPIRRLDAEQVAPVQQKKDEKEEKENGSEE